jgi:alpha/beta superfamily hydrolase
MAFAPLAPVCTVDAVAGDRDDYVDSAALTAWPGVTARPVAGADHFFSGRQRDLVQVLTALTLDP